MVILNKINLQFYILFLLFSSFIIKPLSASALLGQTQADLTVLEDQLQNEVQKNPAVLQDWSPFLLATPQSYWKESAQDFSIATLEILKKVFPQSAIIPCAECVENRTFVAHDGRLVINNGELSLVDYAALKSRPEYRDVKAVFILKETPSGIESRLMSLNDGKILFMKLADSSHNLDQAVAPLHLAKELERREKGQSLNYVFIDAGLYMGTTFQVEFLEQWGSRNQHLSGLVLSLYEPAGGLGGTYHYLIPGNRKLNVSATVFLTLDSFNSSAKSSNSPFSVVSQGMVQYAVSGNYAFFGMINSRGTVALGISFLNPVLFPFLL